MVEGMKIPRLLDTVARRKREPSPLAMLRAASRHRDAGRLDEALKLIIRALAAEPNSITGHVLAGNLYVAAREMGPARLAFEHVLELDPHQPRALLGLGRIALEESDAGACRVLLERALERYPDFPEAQALLEVVQSPPPPTVPFAIPPPPLVLPRRARQLVLVDRHGGVLRAAPPDTRGDGAAQHVHRVSRLAGAILGRAGLGSLCEAVLESTHETTLLKCNEHATLSVTFPLDVPRDTAGTEVDRLWAAAGALDQVGSRDA
jgi:tetratricopeptide (TPR) repeat protein